MRLRETTVVSRDAVAPGEQAQPDFLLLQRALEEQDAVERGAGGFGQQGGVIRGLRRPDLGELVLDVAALRVEVVALVVAVHPDAGGVAGGEA